MDLMGRTGVKMYEITGWNEYQHYGDKKQVPWIKLHFRLLTSESWIMLDDSHRCLMITCMLHASEHHGRIEKSIEYLKNLGRINGNVSFKPLIELGFIRCLDSVYTESRQIQNESTDSISLSSSYSESKGGAGEKSEVPPSTMGSPPADIPIPDMIPKKDWDDFVDMRKSMKKPLTLRAKEILIKKLTDWFAKGHSPSEILQNSVANNWQGLFEPKTSTKGNYNGKTSIHQPSQAATDARRSVLANLVRERESGQHPAMAS